MGPLPLSPMSSSNEGSASMVEDPSFSPRARQKPNAIEFASDAAAGLLKDAKCELEGASIWDIFTHDSRKDLESGLKQVIEARATTRTNLSGVEVDLQLAAHQQQQQQLQLRQQQQQPSGAGGTISLCDAPPQETVQLPQVYNMGLKGLSSRGKFFEVQVQGVCSFYQDELPQCVLCIRHVSTSSNQISQPTRYNPSVSQPHRAKSNEEETIEETIEEEESSALVSETSSSSGYM